MTFSHQLIAGDTLANIAEKFLDDPMRFRDIANVNAIDIFEEIPIGDFIDIPDLDQIIEPARPLLGKAKSILSKATEIGDILQKIPGLETYTSEALKYIGNINGGIDSIESTIDEYIGEAERILSGKGTYKIVDWLLHGQRPSNFVDGQSAGLISGISNVVGKII